MFAAIRQKVSPEAPRNTSVTSSFTGRDDGERRQAKALCSVARYGSMCAIYDERSASCRSRESRFKLPHFPAVPSLVLEQQRQARERHATVRLLLLAGLCG